MTIKKVLFIHLKDDLLAENIKTITSYRNNNPHDEIHLLTEETNQNICEVFKGNLDQCHYIQTDRIKKLKDSKLFSDAFALNQYLQDISQVSEIDWGRTVALTNNYLTSLVLTFIESDSRTGVHFTEEKYTIYNNKWERIRNIILSSENYFNSSVINNFLLDQSYDFNTTLKLDKEVENIINKNFMAIRNKVGSDVNIVGVQVDHKLALSFEELCLMINMLFNNFNTYPVLIYKAEPQNIELINKTSSVFENNIICIKCDDSSISGILNNLDIFISHQSKFRALCDYTDTPSISIVADINYSKLPLNEVGYIVKNNKDIIETVSKLTSKILNPLESLDLNSKEYVYKNITVNDVSVLKPLNTNDEKGIQALLKAAYVLQIANSNNYKYYLQVLKQYPIETISQIIQKEKSFFTAAVRTILTMIKETKAGLKGETQTNEFILGLNTLFTMAEETNFVSLPLRAFKDDVENISSVGREENLTRIEDYLFELKDNIKLFTGLMDQIIQISPSSSQITT